MKLTRTFAVGGAIAVVGLTGAGSALAAGTSVSVRIEGIKRTLLGATVVKSHSGSITKGGAPAGACPATDAVGALDVATHHHWNGSYSTYGLSVTSILGEAHAFTSKDYWSIFVDNKFATAGICGLKLHRGEQILFAAVPQKGSEYPLVISAPRRATAGKPFTVKVSYFNAKGASKPVAGVAVKGGLTTNAQGTTTVTASKSGKLILTAAHAGYIRDEATVTVAG
jgi:hypothetical protein